MENQKTKIIFYSGHCEIVGGDAKYLFELVNYLNNQKYELKVYADKNPIFAQRAKQWLTKDVAIHYLDTRPVLFANTWLDRVCATLDTVNLHIMGIKLARIVRKILRIVTFMDLRDDLHNVVVFRQVFKQGDADIFHFNNGGYPGKRAGLLAILVAKWYGVKNIVMTIQNLPVKRSPLRVTERFVDFLINRATNMVVAVSDKLAMEMQQGRGFLRNRLMTIFHGLEDGAPMTVTEQGLKRQQLKIDANAAVLLMTSNIDEDRKGHTVLLAAMVEVVKRYPKTVLLVAGDGSKRKQFEAFAEELGIQDHVRFLGHRQDVDQLNNIADIAVIPSIAFEGIPYTIREAMRAGKPVITTNAGGCDEAVEHGVSGLIVAQQDQHGLALAITTLLADADMRQKMGAEARKLFLNKFLLANKVREHEVLYDFFSAQMPLTLSREEKVA